MLLSKLNYILHLEKVPYIALVSKYSVPARSREDQAYKTENNLYYPREKSTLYVSGCHARRVYGVLSPFLNLDYITENAEAVEHSILARKLNVDFKSLLPRLKLLRDVQMQVNDIDTTIDKLNKEIQPKPHQTGEELEKLQNKKSEIFDKRTEVKNVMWSLEDEVITELLRLPNRVHPDVQQVDHVLKESVKRLSLAKSHLEIGSKTRCLTFLPLSPTAYYLKGKAALLELAITYFFTNRLQNSHFSRMSGPDFSKSAIIEGCGKDLYALDESIPLSGEEGNIGQVLHLTGTASQEAFAVSMTRMRVSKSSLPIRYFVDGRHYNAVHLHCLPPPSLFSVVQSTQIEYFVATEKFDSESNFDDIVNVISQCYEDINVPFRIVRTSASNLHLSESLRVQFELWSPSLNKYIKCGNVSLHDDYLSKRLLMKYKDKSEIFLHTLGGTAVSAPVLIACIMENLQTSDGSFTIPKSLEPFMVA